MSSLVLYGSQNLSNSKMGISQISGFRGSNSQIQRINNARFPGSTVVDKKVSDRTLSASGVIRSTADLSLEEVINEYSKAFSKEDRYFRISTNYLVFTDLKDGTGWQIQGDTTTNSFDSESFQYEDGSIKFNADVSLGNGYSGVYTETGVEQNLSAYGTTGAFEAWVYLPQTSGVTGIELKVGNDTSNYYSGTVKNQYDDTPFEVGWNYISFMIEEMAVTGVIDPYSIGEYLSIKINYGALMSEDKSDFRLGGIIWQDEVQTRNFRSFVEDFDVNMEHYDISRASFTLSVFAYEGIAESTGDYTVLGVTGLTAITYADDVTFEGSYSPLPKFTINVTSATNVTNITFTNVTTGDEIGIARTYSAGDKIVIDTYKREVLANGTAVDYDDVLPRFTLGKNDIQVSIAGSTLETIDELIQNANLTGEV